MDVERFGERRGQNVEVEIGLDANMTRARAKFVARKPRPEPPKPPVLGDPWCPLTVRARLQRVGWVLAKDPEPGPRKNPRSCMPEPVRELFKDQKGEPMRMPVPSADQDAVTDVLKDLMRFKDDDEARYVVFSIAGKLGGEKLAEFLHCSDTHARKLQKRMLDDLASAWKGYSWQPDARDIERAKKLIHRNIK